jgi:hypothetical protein
MERIERTRGVAMQLPVFDKLDDRLVEWVERQAVTAFSTQTNGRLSSLTRKLLVTQSVPPIGCQAHGDEPGHARRWGFSR